MTYPDQLRAQAARQAAAKWSRREDEPAAAEQAEPAAGPATITLRRRIAGEVIEGEYQVLTTSDAHREARVAWEEIRLYTIYVHRVESRLLLDGRDYRERREQARVQLAGALAGLGLLEREAETCRTLIEICVQVFDDLWPPPSPLDAAATIQAVLAEVPGQRLAEQLARVYCLRHEAIGKLLTRLAVDDQARAAVPAILAATETPDDIRQLLDALVG